MTNENTPKKFVLQIKNPDPDIMRRVRVYEANHSQNGYPMEHAAFLKRAVEALEEQELNAKKTGVA